MEDKLIFITNDDGIQAPGIQVLARLMSRLGRVVVVAPDSARSGAACSITSGVPVMLTKVDEPQMLFLPATWAKLDLLDCFGENFSPRNPIAWYTCTGTPVDCVKLGSEQALNRAPDLMVSGINHGDNTSCSVHYSGTVGAVVEACSKGWPAIAFSLCTFLKNPDFSPYADAVVKIASAILAKGMPSGECLNVNFPVVQQLKGVRVARLARGEWTGEWASASNPHGKQAFWLTGEFRNLEPESRDTDCAALDEGYASVTPIRLDMTAYDSIQNLKNLLE